jgi:hypothetical protein
MSRERSLADKLRSWDQLAVLALVVVITEVSGTCWLQNHHPNALPSTVTIDPDMIDDDLERLIRRAALENGMDPDDLPSMEALAAQVSQVHAIKGDLDVDDHNAVQQAMITHIGDLATLNVPQGGGREPGGERDVRPGPGGSPSGDGAATNRLAPSIERIDELRAMRLTELATTRGLDPATLLPSDELRQAAIASGSADSEASKALQQAYREVFAQLESTSSPAVSQPAQP